MEMIIQTIKAILVRSHGILLMHDNCANDELSEYRRDILKDLEMRKIHEDKQNLRRDGQHVKADFKKAYKAYHTECING